MPANSIVSLGREGQAYRAVLWADVPAGNQAAYANPAAESAYGNIDPVELQAIRNGQVAEKVVTWAANSGATTWTNAAAAFVTMLAEWQAEVSAVAVWADYGRKWNGSTWAATTGVPMAAVKEANEGLPSFIFQTPVSAWGASKFHFVLYNGAALATGQSMILKVRLLVYQPGVAAVTGTISGPWTVRRREAPTTPPSGAGGLTPFLCDSAQPLSAGIGAWNAPGTPPAGGTSVTLFQWIPQPDEVKVSTMDAPTMASLGLFGGQVIYSADLLKPARPLILRPGQTCEIQQDATAGVGGGRIVCVFTVG